jgi:hypothetical protein
MKNKVGVIHQRISKTGKPYQLIRIGYNQRYIAVDNKVFEIEA